MSLLKVNTIRHSTATSDAITLASDGTATAKLTNRQNRNLIINGAMNVAQRGGAASTTNGYGSVDRFKIGSSGTDELPSHQQVDVTSSDTGPWEEGFGFQLKVTNGNQSSGAGAGDDIKIETALEAMDMGNCGWDYTDSNSYITLSFWVKSSVAQNFYGYLQTIDGSGQRYPFETGSLSANTWAKITKTIPGHANLTFNNNWDKGLGIVISPFLGTDSTASGVTLNAWGAWDSAARTPDYTSTWYTTNDATFHLTGVQLELGATATEFEHRPYSYEEARCQRYHYVLVDGNTQSFGIGTYSGTSTVYCHVPFPVTMRATPTLTVNNDGTNYWYTWYSNDSSNAEKGDNFVINGAHTRGAIIKDPSASGTNGTGAYGRTSSSSAKISFSAEL